MPDARKLYQRTPGGPNVHDMALAKEEFARRLRTARERANLTQQQVADQIGVDWRLVQRWDTGRAMPRAQRIPELATVLGVDPGYLNEPVSEHAVDRTLRIVEENAVTLRTALGLLDTLGQKLDQLTAQAQARYDHLDALTGQVTARLEAIEARQDAADTLLSQVQTDFLQALGAAGPRPAADEPGQAESTGSSSSPGNAP